MQLLFAFFLNSTLHKKNALHASSLYIYSHSIHSFTSHSDILNNHTPLSFWTLWLMEKPINTLYEMTFSNIIPANHINKPLYVTNYLSFVMINTSSLFCKLRRCFLISLQYIINEYRIWKQ